jgi:hypothetical protein
MAPTLPSDMARKSVATLLERVEQQDAFSPDEGRDLLASCEMGFLVLERVWVLAQGFLDRGMESWKLTLLLKEFVDVLEVGVKAFDVARERVKSSGLTSQDKAEGLSALGRAERRAAEMREELSSLVNWLETPFPEIDPQSLPERVGEREAEGYITLDDLTNRLLSAKDASQFVLSVL